MTRLFLMLCLCLAVLCGSGEAATDANSVIVAGQPPLTRDGLARSQQFFEWALGGSFTPAEQAAYQQLVLQIWHKGDHDSIQTLTQIMDLQSRLLASSESERAAAAREAQSSLVTSLRAQPKDALAAMLISAYGRIHQLNVRQGGALAAAPAPSPAAKVDLGASWLVGEWQESHMGNTAYRSSTGSYSGPNGEKILLRFFPDGTYKSAYMTQTALYSCSSNVYIGATGVYRLEPQALHLDEKTCRIISKDTCTARYNYDRTEAPRSYAYPWQRGQDPNGAAIVLMIGGQPHTFVRQPGPGLLGQ